MSTLSPSLALRAVVFVLLMVGYYVWTWSHNLRDLGGDNAIYLLTAQHFSPWQAQSNLAADVSRSSSYPPLFPFLLGIANLGNNIAVAHAMTTSFLLAAFLCLYAWLKTMGHSATTAGIFTLIFAVLPGTYTGAVSILSENLYLLCTLVTLVAATRFEKEVNARWLWLAAGGVAMSVLTRSAGLSLYLAFLVFLFVRRIPQRYRLGLAPLLPILLWEILQGMSQPGYVASLLRSYSSDSPAGLFAQMHLQITAVGRGWVENFAAMPVAKPVAIVVGVIGLAGMARRVYLKKLDGYYALAYLGLILIWPYPAESKRLIFVVIPVLLAQGLDLLLLIPSTILSRYRVKAAIVVYLGALLLISLPVLVLVATQFIRGGLGEQGYFAVARAGILPDSRLTLGISTAKIENELKQISGHFKEKDCIYSIKPSIVSFYTKTRSLIPPPSHVDAAEFERLITESECRFFYVMPFVSPTYPESHYPLGRLVPKIRFLSLVTLEVGSDDRLFSALVERMD